jgi:hypothetical protein
MASSVSSERAFSQGGITIRKHRNRLKGDVVEALQCIKCAIRHDLLFRELGPSSLVEEDSDAFEDAGHQSEDNVEEEGWDDVLLEEEDDCSDSNDEMHET